MRSRAPIGAWRSVSAPSVIADEREPVRAGGELRLLALEQERGRAGRERLAGELAAAREREQQHVVAGIADLARLPRAELQRLERELGAALRRDLAGCADDAHQRPRYALRSSSFSSRSAALPSRTTAPGREDVAAVGDRQRDVRVLLDDEHRDTRVVHLLDDLEAALDEHRREAHRRLVHQQQLRLRHQRAAHRDHLLLAARQRAGELGAPLVEEREQRRRRARTPPSGRPSAAGRRPSRGSRAPSSARTAAGSRARSRARA